jgi:DNA-binding CsgD family transcriptional regulator
MDDEARRPGAASTEELSTATERLVLPVALIDLADLTIRAVSVSAAEHLGRGAGIVGSDVSDCFDESDRPRTTQALQALRSGVLDSYRARRWVVGEDGTRRATTLWVQALIFADERLALVQLDFAEGSPASPLAAFLGQEPTDVAVGIVDASWVVTSVSNDVSAVAGIAPEALIGQRLLRVVEPDDVARLLAAETDDDTSLSVGVHVTIAPATGPPALLCCILTRMVGSDDLVFALSRLLTAVDAAPGSAERVTRLERHLQRIAAEIEASGVLVHQLSGMPNPAPVRELRDLTTRQWEVLSRLLRGERVPTIAAALFISQSTVRNHLVAIFERFGVHSQPELLALLTRGGTDELRV